MKKFGNKYSLILVLFCTAAVASVNINTKGMNVVNIINSNTHASNFIQSNTDHSSNNSNIIIMNKQDTNTNTKNSISPTRIENFKFCQACHKTDHFDSNSSLCKWNALRDTDAFKLYCKTCGFKDHSRLTSSLCPENYINRQNNVQRQCSSCNGSDHISIKSNLCTKNPQSPFFDGEKVCIHCSLPGHTQKRSLDCKKNPKHPEYQVPVTKIIQLTEFTGFATTPYVSFIQVDKSKIQNRGQPITLNTANNNGKQ
jgi:hypothetical protein